MNFFQNLLSSIMSRSRQGGYFRSKDFGILHEDINKALESVMSKSGEVSSLVYAEHLSHLIEGLDDEQFIDFFNVLKEKYDIDADSLSKASKEYSIDQNIQEDILLKQALVYLIDSDRTDGFPNDPVAKFHLGNGAIIERVNLNADLSVKGIEQSKGIMVNYLYDLDVLEQNHELFFKTKKVQLSSGIISLRKKLQIH